MTSLERLSVHRAVDGIVVFHHNRQFAIMYTQLRSIVDVGATADDNSIVDYEKLAVDV